MSKVPQGFDVENSELKVSLRIFGALKNASGKMD